MKPLPRNFMLSVMGLTFARRRGGTRMATNPLAMRPIGARGRGSRRKEAGRVHPKIPAISRLAHSRKNIHLINGAPMAAHEAAGAGPVRLALGQGGQGGADARTVVPGRLLPSVVIDCPG